MVLILSNSDYYDIQEGFVQSHLLKVQVTKLNKLKLNVILASTGRDTLLHSL